MRASSLSYNTIAVNREIDSAYDAVLEVRDNLTNIAKVAGLDIDTILADLQDASADVLIVNTAKTTAVNASTAASLSSVVATTKASEASASASAALVSETNANTSKNSAATSATTATTKASEASASATTASVSATNAASSASSALTSASISTTKATEAAASASTALGYKNDVNAMKLAIETIYDTFDDRFLGTKTTNPSVDNDGNALIDGVLFFDTTTNAMKVYDAGTTTWYSIPQIYLNSLLDVQLTSLTTGHTLVWNGTKWANGSLSKSSVGLGSVDNTADNTKKVLSATTLATARTINGVSFDGTANITVTANANLAGNLLKAVPANALFTDTIYDDSTTTKQGNSFNGISQLVKTDASGKLPAIDGSLLTNLASSVGAMELIQTIEVTSAVSSIDITNLPDGIYEIRAFGLTASASGYTQIRAFDGAGKILTATVYAYSGINTNAGSVNSNAYNGADHIRAASGTLVAGKKANVNINFSVSSVNKYLMAETFLFNYPYYPTYCLLGADVTTDKVTGIRIFESAGSIVAGTVYVYKLKV